MRFVRFFAVAAAALLLCACSDALRVATFNVRGPYDGEPNTWEERAPRIRKIVEDNDFDLFGVQEAFRAVQIAEIAKLSGYDFIIGKNEGFKHAGNRNAIFYRTDRLELLEQGVFTLSDTPEIAGSKNWGNSEARYVVWGKFRDKRTGREFFHFNTHFDHKSGEARIKSVALILARIREQAGDLPVVLTGDFNVSPRSKVYAAVLEELKDSRSLSETPSTGSEWTFNGYSTRQRTIGDQIDFIFVREGTKVLSHRTIDTLIDGKFPSDHYPVTAELVWE